LDFHSTMIQISDECDMYLVRSKEHKQQVQDLEDFERKPLIVDELASTITLQIDKLTLIERIRQYYCQEINRDVIIVACERFGSDNGEIHFRLEQIKSVEFKTRRCFQLIFHVEDGNIDKFFPILIETAAFLATGSRDCIDMAEDAAGNMVLIPNF